MIIFSWCVKSDSNSSWLVKLISSMESWFIELVFLSFVLVSSRRILRFFALGSYLQLGGRAFLLVFWLEVYLYLHYSSFSFLAYLSLCIVLCAGLGSCYYWMIGAIYLGLGELPGIRSLLFWEVCMWHMAMLSFGRNTFMFSQKSFVKEEALETAISSLTYISMSPWSLFSLSSLNGWKPCMAASAVLCCCWRAWVMAIMKEFSS